MQVRVALGLSLLLFAGCATQPSAHPSPPVDSPEAIRLQFGCGPTPNENPCITAWNTVDPAQQSAGGLAGLAVDPYVEGRVALMLWTPMPASVAAPYPEAGAFVVPGRIEVAVTADNGTTWQRHLVPHGADVAHPYGALRYPTAAWTRSGELLVMAFLEEAPLIVQEGTAIAGTTQGPDWIGASADGGATWQTRFIGPSLPNGVPTLREVSPGHFIGMRTGADRQNTLVESLDDGVTWTSEVLALDCVFPHAISAAGDDLLVGCDNGWGWAGDDVHTYAVHRAQHNATRRTDVKVPDGCTGAGPARAPDGALHVVLACKGLKLYSSKDDGLTWTLSNDTVAVPETSWAFNVRVAVGSDGLVTAAADLWSTSASGACCDSQFWVAAWTAAGTLVQATDWPGPRATDQVETASNFSCGVGVSPGGRVTWFVLCGTQPGYGWLRVAPQ